MSLHGKVVIITGGAMGIGRHNARVFAADGARLAIADVAPMDNVIREVTALGAEILPVPTDIRDEEQVRSLMARVHEHYGAIDVLINGAAIVTHFAWTERWPPVKDMDLQYFPICLIG
jgi:NAD(P)-dependent dehydrogenase (short-subunit alcohol dehydrogenase family)